MADWKDIGGGWRTWKSVVTPARWHYDASGELTAIGTRGQQLPTGPDAGPGHFGARAKVVCADRVRELVAAGATPFEQRALLAIGLHESGFRLPAWGDCRKDGVPVPCGTPGADPPLSVGYYQFLRSTAGNMGVTFDELASSPMANHRAALRLARALAPHVAGDLPTLAACWGAGSVRADPSKDWGVHTWAPGTLTEFAQAWNAAGPYVQGKPAGGGDDDVAVIVGGLLLLKGLGAV